MRRILLVILLSACVEYTPKGIHEDGPELDDSGVDPAVPLGSGASPERCDGVDNNGNGRIDEGYGDVDGDGVADCVDAECALVPHESVAILDLSACVGGGPRSVDPWNIEGAWDFSDLAIEQTRVADLDGDGASEVIGVEPYFGPGQGLVVLSGVDGSVEWRADAIAAGSGFAIADLDVDGSLDIVGYSGDGALTAVDASGNTKWTSPLFGPTRGISFTHMDVQVADVDADGLPEVIVDHGIVRGLDGTAVAVLDTSDDNVYLNARELAVADLDGDNIVDIVNWWRRYQADGTLVWDVTPEAPSREMAAPLLLQADSDPDAEVFWIGETDLLLVDADGSELYSSTPSASDYAMGFGCAGDIDGDGAMEVIFSDLGHVRARRPHGEELWAIPIEDSTYGSVGCTTFDFDLDGRKEVVAWDMYHLWILDGTTGIARFQDDTWWSGTTTESPIIADLDGDGSVEILAIAPQGPGWDYPTYRVYRNVNRDWPPGTNMWPSSNWSGTSLNADGSVPRTADKPWLTTKVWRGQPEFRLTGRDLAAGLGDTCVASCETGGLVRVAVHVDNLGPEEVTGVTPLAVYAVASDGTRSLVTVMTLTEWIDNGWSSADVEVDLTAEQARNGVVFVAGDDGSGAVPADDCDPSNNALAWALTECG